MPAGTVSTLKVSPARHTLALAPRPSREVTAGHDLAFDLEIAHVRGFRKVSETRMHAELVHQYDEGRREQIVDQGHLDERLE